MIYLSFAETFLLSCGETFGHIRVFPALAKGVSGCFAFEAPKHCRTVNPVALSLEKLVRKWCVVLFLMEVAPTDPFAAQRAERERQKKPKASLLRSEPMVLLQMIVQAEAASETMEELGEIASVMFCDLNSGTNAFKRNFVRQVKDCEEVDRCLRLIGAQVSIGWCAITIFR